MRSARKGACRPTTDQERLLEAILLSGDQAIDAWHTWRRHGDIDDLDPAAFQIMPLLYWNLARQGVDDPSMEKLRGIHRVAWSRNQFLVSQALAALRTFHEEGIPMMLLKGAALNTLYGDRYGIRLISDVDLLVPKGDARRAVGLLEGLGWTPKGDPPRATAEFVSVSKGLGLVHQGGGALDLHWHVFPEDLVAEHEEPVWRYAIQAPIAGVPTSVPSPTEMLLHVCVHGWAWCTHPPFRWVADAMTILKVSPAGIEWERLLEDARRRHFVPRLESALAYLHERFGAEIPSHVLTELRTTPVSRSDRREYRLRTRPVRTPVGGLILHVLRFHRLHNESGLESGVQGFLDYLRCRWGLERVSQVPLRMVSKLAHRFARSLHRKAD